MPKFSFLFNVPAPVTAVVPHREQTVVAYKTDTFIEIYLEIKKSDTYAVLLESNDDELFLRAKEILEYILVNGSPDRLSVGISYKIIGNCYYRPSILLALALSLIGALERIYEENIEESDKVGILHGVVSALNTFEPSIVHAISTSIIKKESIVFSSTQGGTTLENLQVICKIKDIKKASMQEPSKLERILDLLAKLNSLLVIEHIDSLKTRDTTRKELAERAISSLYYIIYGLPPSNLAITVPELSESFAYLEILIV